MIILNLFDASKLLNCRKKKNSLLCNCISHLVEYVRCEISIYSVETVLPEHKNTHTHRASWNEFTAEVRCHCHFLLFVLLWQNIWRKYTSVPCIDEPSGCHSMVTTCFTHTFGRSPNHATLFTTNVKARQILVRRDVVPFSIPFRAPHQWAIMRSCYLHDKNKNLRHCFIHDFN